jgi:DNA-binding transcriptional ArsR family regulator
VSSPGVVAPLKEWSFLSNHARVLLCVAHDPGIRLRDIATTLGITERTAHGIVADLADAGYVVKERDGRRNRYKIQHHLPLPEATASQRTIGEVLDLLVETNTPNGRRPSGKVRKSSDEFGHRRDPIRARSFRGPSCSRRPLDLVTRGTCVR